VFIEEGKRSKVRLFTGNEARPNRRTVEPSNDRRSKAVHAKDRYAGIDEAGARVLVTGWPEFLGLDWLPVKPAMRRPLILDGRNALDREKLTAEGFESLGVGRGPGRTGGVIIAPSLKLPFLVDENAPTPRHWLEFARLDRPGALLLSCEKGDRWPLVVTPSMRRS
jgi:UDP-glucose/GDP-mannose dehydrogenase family protein